MNQLMFFFMGFATCFAIVTIIWQIQVEDYENQIRYWRKQALKESRNK